MNNLILSENISRDLAFFENESISKELFEMSVILEINQRLLIQVRVFLRDGREGLHK